MPSLDMNYINVRLYELNNDLLVKIYQKFQDSIHPKGSVTNKMAK